MAMPAEFQELAKKVNNWGRWGADDEIGTLNLITPEAVRRGVDCVHTGRAFPLGIPLSEAGPQTGYIPGRINPLRTMISLNTPLTGDPDEICFNDDVVVMGLQAATHWDSLVHAGYAGRLYNGLPPETVGVHGASRCGIASVRTLVTRGVLLDVARARGVDRLEGGYPVGAEDLDAAEALAGIQVLPGDVVLVRTGHMRLFKAGDRRAYAAPSPGPTLSAVTWFHERDVAAVATDNLTFEAFPAERPGLLLPIHLLHLVEMGLTQGQNFDLEELATYCATDGRYAFLLEATPEPFVGGLGGPVNPVALL
jgi:kynurenine formamidase